MNLNTFQLFDAHLHIIDPRFPLIANQGYLPAPFTVADYRARTAAYNLIGGAIVSGSFQAFDQSYLRAALAELGPGFVGVTQLPATVRDAEILDLHNAGPFQPQARRFGGDRRSGGDGAARPRSGRLACRALRR